MPKTLKTFVDLAEISFLPQKPSFEEARAQRMAEEAEVLRLCDENRRREEAEADIRHSRKTPANSIWRRTHENLKPINAQAASDVGLGRSKVFFDPEI